MNRIEDEVQPTQEQQDQAELAGLQALYRGDEVTKSALAMAWRLGFSRGVSTGRQHGSGWYANPFW